MSLTETTTIPKSDLRERIERGFEGFGNAVYRRPWLTLLAVLLLVGALAMQIPKLTLDTSTEGFLHEDDPTLLAYNDFRAQFGRDEQVVLAIEAPDVFDPDVLRRLKALHEALEANAPHLDDITSLVNARNTRGEGDDLIVEDLLENWPETPEQIAAVRERANGNPLYRDLLLSADNTLTTIVIKTNAYSGGNTVEDVLAGFDAAPAEEAPAERKFLTDEENSEIVAAIRKIAEPFDSEGFRVHIAGSPVVTHVLKEAIKTNMGRFLLMAVLLIGVILGLLFRRLSGVVLPLLVVAVTLFSTLGLMGLAGIAFKLPTQILPSFLLAVGVGASVHILAIFYRKLQQGGNKGEAIGYALGHSGLAVTMTSLTTAAGLASFSGAAVAPVGDLGRVAAIGVGLSLVYTLVLLPALLAIIPIKPKTGTPAQTRGARMDRLLAGAANLATSRPKTVLAVSALVLAFGLGGALQVQFSHEPHTWLPTSNPARQASDFIDEKMNGANVIEVVVDTGEVNGLYAPAVMNALETLGHDIDAMDGEYVSVGKTLSLADVLKETHQALNENRREFYAIPQERDIIAQELFLFENSGSDDLEDFVDSQFQLARFTAKMPWADAIHLRDFIADVEAQFADALGAGAAITVTGMNALLSRTMTATIESMAESYLWAALVITLMMILLIGNIRVGLISMIPNLTPIILTLGLMGWLGLPLDLFTMLIGSIAIGLAVDDTIHFMHNYRRYHRETGDVAEAVRQTLLTSGRAMLVTTVVLSAGFFIFVFSTLSNLINFGLLTGFTIIAALLADFFLAPALMAQLHASRVLADEDEY